MHRLTLLAGLTYVVQVIGKSATAHSCYPAWETIAAFNCLSAARAYANNCKMRNSKTGLDYRFFALQNRKEI